MYGVLCLRFVVVVVLEAEDVTHGVLFLRFAAAGYLSGSWGRQRLYRGSLAAYESLGPFPPGLRGA